MRSIIRFPASIVAHKRISGQGGDGQIAGRPHGPRSAYALATRMRKCYDEMRAYVRVYKRRECAAMSSRSSKDSEPAGEIRLRQTAQLSVADQTRTFEIAVTLPAGASDEEIDRAARQAEIGMRALSEQMDRHIAAVRETAGGQMIDAAHAPGPMLAEPQPNGAHASAGTAAVPPADTAPETPADDTLPAGKRAATRAPAPEPPKTTGMDLQAFLAEAGTMGYDIVSAAKALGLTSLKDVDLAQALEQLRALHAASPAPVPEPPAHAFAEEIGPYDSVSDADDLAEMDEPDFGALPDEPDDAAFAGEPEAEAESAQVATSAAQANATEARRTAEAERRLRQLRAISGGAATATPELRTALGN